MEIPGWETDLDVSFWGVIELSSLEATCKGITIDFEQCSYDHYIYILFILILRHLFAFTGLVVAGAVVLCNFLIFATFVFHSQRGCVWQKFGWMSTRRSEHLGVIRMNREG